MAQHLLFTYTLLVDISPYSAGDKIYTYWDDSTSLFVVKADVNTQGFGANIAASFNGGLYETSETGWFSVADEIYNGDVIGEGTDVGPQPSTTATRSNTYAHSGTYSGRFEALATTSYFPTFQNAPFEVGKNYRVSCYVRVNSATPYTFNHAGTVTLISGSGTELTINNVVTKTITECESGWQLVQCDVHCNSIGTLRQYVILKINGATAVPGGYIYVDDFLIKEITGFSISNSTITSGPDLGRLFANRTERWHVDNSQPYSLPTDTGVTLKAALISNYSYCSGVNLVGFHVVTDNPPFPYAVQDITYDSPTCGYIAPCDIHFTGNPIITKPSNPFASDGSVQVAAISSKSSVKYSFNSDPGSYSAYTNTSGLFSSIASGIYTIYARDVNNCITSITVQVSPVINNDPVPDPTPTYNIKYRVEQKDLLNGVISRADILERGFSGTLTEISKSGPSPFVRILPNISVNNKFEALRPTSATLTIVSMKDLQFIGLFSQDDRKFKVKYYKPVGTLNWSGFIVPSTFNQTYTESPPYYTILEISDNLKELESLDFLDKDGNKLSGLKSLIQIAAFILEKLSLDINIRVACNIREESQTSSGGVAFTETYENLEVFYESDGTPWKCDRVLRYLIEPFTAKIVQENGVWNIVRVEEQTGSYDYVEYTSAGVYSTSGTYNPIINIESPSVRMNAIFETGSGHALLEMVPAYGKIKLVRRLNNVGNLVLNGSFDISKFSNNQIEGWSVNKLGASGTALYTVESIIQRNLTTGEITPGSYALAISELENDAYMRVVSKPIKIEFGNNDSFTFSFKYRVNLVATDRDVDNPKWVKLVWNLKVGGYYFVNKIGWVSESSSDNVLNDLYIENYNTDETFEITIDFFPVVSSTNSTITITFFTYGSDQLDYSGGDVTSENSATLQVGKRILGLQSGQYYWYKLMAGTDATSLPDVGRPSDYNAVTNASVWKLEEITTGAPVPVGKFYIDDVSIIFNPNKQKAPDSETITSIINTNFKENLEIEIEGADAPKTVHSGQYIYNNYFKDSAGNPTIAWTRDAVTSESSSLQQIFVKSLTNQYKYPTFKVSGNFIGWTELNFLTTFKHTQEQPIFTLVNEDFTGSITGWTNVTGGTPAWTYNSNKARYSAAVATTSSILRQTTPVSFDSGQRIRIDFSITRSASSGTRDDWFYIVFLDSSNNIIQEVVSASMSSDGTWTRSIRLSTSQDCANIGFYIRYMNGTGYATYDLDYFRLAGLIVTRYFTLNSMEIDSQQNMYRVEMMQLVPVVPSTDPDVDDSGEGNTNTEGGGGGGTSGGGSSSGSGFTGGFSGGFGAGFDTILN